MNTKINVQSVTININRNMFKNDHFNFVFYIWLVTFVHIIYINGEYIKLLLEIFTAFCFNSRNRKKTVIPRVTSNDLIWHQNLFARSYSNSKNRNKSSFTLIYSLINKIYCKILFAIKVFRWVNGKMKRKN